ncbi:MAG: hypothetical protein QM817_24365 [Archangium sp.]
MSPTWVGVAILPLLFGLVFGVMGLSARESAGIRERERERYASQGRTAECIPDPTMVKTTRTDRRTYRMSSTFTVHCRFVVDGKVLEQTFESSANPDELASRAESLADYYDELGTTGLSSNNETLAERARAMASAEWTITYLPDHPRESAVLGPLKRNFPTRDGGEDLFKMAGVAFAIGAVALVIARARRGGRPQWNQPGEG